MPIELATAFLREFRLLRVKMSPMPGLPAVNVGVTYRLQITRNTATSKANDAH
jgi:hypothetical protein